MFFISSDVPTPGHRAVAESFRLLHKVVILVEPGAVTELWCIEAVTADQRFRRPPSPRPRETMRGK